MIVIFDKCVILDSLMDRKPFSDDSNELFKMMANGVFEGLVSVKTMMDLHYILKNYTHNEEKTRSLLKKLSTLFEVVSSNTYDCIKSLDSKITDYEDAMMAQTAESIKADYIITRNIKDFKYSNIKAINPANFLSVISKQD